MNGIVLVVIVGLILGISSSFITPSFGQIQGSVAVQTEEYFYETGDEIEIYGSVRELYSGTPISLIMKAPNGNLVFIVQLSVQSDKTFEYEFDTEDSKSLMKTDGEYTITAQYGTPNRSAETTIEFNAITSTPQPTPNPTPGSNDIIITAAKGSGVPGCEETAEGCYIPSTVTVGVGDTIIFSNTDNAAHTFTSGDPKDSASTGAIFDSSLVMMGSTFEWSPTEEGEVPYYCMVHPWMKALIIVSGSGSTSPPPNDIVDNAPPLVIVPSNITVDATASYGAQVEYSVKAIDNIDGIITPNCELSSGSIFPIGENTVSCFAVDAHGNSSTETFMVTVNAPSVLIPDWIQDVAQFWCADEIDDAGFIKALEYLIENNVIIVPPGDSGTVSTQEIPSWIKNNACWWSEGKISDKDFASGIQFLVSNGIIQV